MPMQLLEVLVARALKAPLRGFFQRPVRGQFVRVRFLRRYAEAADVPFR
jgi:hypothetical protein